MLKPKNSQWMQIHSLNKPKKFNKHCLLARMLMATVSWDRKGVIMVKFVQQGTTITSEVYCEALKNCRGPFRPKGMEC
jgi:hypothetical protein